MRLVRFELDNGGSVLVEVDETPETSPASRRGRLPLDAKVSFENAIGNVRDAAEAALDQLRDIRPDEVEIKFGIQLDVEAGAVIARTGMKGHFEVKLKWQRQPVGAAVVTDAPPILTADPESPRSTASDVAPGSG